MRSYVTGALAFRREELLRFAHLLALLVIRVAFLHLVMGSCRGLKAEFLTTLYRWTLMQFIASYVATGVGLAAAHHHPTTWHAGDAINVNDWGVHQICATRDRPDIDPNDFWATCTYGRHVLHHLFPTGRRVFATPVEDSGSFSRVCCLLLLSPQWTIRSCRCWSLCSRAPAKSLASTYRASVDTRVWR